MNKVADWRSKLAEHIEANRHKAHEWGEHDCGLWADSCLVVTTGASVAADIRGRYKDAAGAVRAMKKAAGVKTPEAFAEARLGPAKPPAFAMAGDVVAADLTALGIAGDERQIGLSLGVCNGAVCYFVSDAGLVELPTLQMVCAYNG